MPPEDPEVVRLRAARRRKEDPAREAAIQRRAQLSTKYGMTPEDYEAQLEEQGERCAICSARDAGGRFTRFFVDHDHKTGEPRGLLCNRCNRAMGMFEDGPMLLLAAAMYLDWRPWQVPQSRRAQLSLVDDEEAC